MCQKGNEFTPKPPLAEIESEACFDYATELVKFNTIPRIAHHGWRSFTFPFCIIIFTSSKQAALVSAGCFFLSSAFFGSAC